MIKEIYLEELQYVRGKFIYIMQMSFHGIYTKYIKFPISNHLVLLLIFKKKTYFDTDIHIIFKYMFSSQNCFTNHSHNLQ